MSRIPIHVAIDENLMERIDRLVSIGDMSKSEIVRRTLGYGIGEMEKAINRLIGEKEFEYRYDIQDNERL